MRRGELLPLPLERMREGRRTVLGRISSGSRVSKMGKSGSEQHEAGGLHQSVLSSGRNQQ